MQIKYEVKLNTNYIVKKFYIDAKNVLRCVEEAIEISINNLFIDITKIKLKYITSKNNFNLKIRGVGIYE